MRRGYRLVVIVSLLPLAYGGDVVSARVARPKQTTQSSVNSRSAHLPLRFEINAGQWDERVRFVARTRGTNVLLTDDGMLFSLHRSSHQRRARADENAVVELRVVGARAVVPEPSEELLTKSNFFLGDDPSAWRRAVSSFHRVTYRSVRDGVDLAVHDDGSGSLEYDLVVAPRASLSSVALDIVGAESVALSGDDGSLTIHTEQGDIRQPPPHVVQRDDVGRETALAAKFVLDGARLTFDVPGYDRTRPLVIDPVAYATYFGGSGDEYTSAVGVDASGDAFIGGTTSSVDFPTHVPLQAALNGGTDAFVAKLDPSGAAVVYSTYFGGSDSDGVLDLAVDGTGDCFATGYASAGFPTKGPLQGSQPGFTAELDPTGSDFVFSTTYASGNAIAIDNQGAVYLTGETLAGLATTANAFQQTFAGSETVNHGVGGSVAIGDAFVTKLAPGAGVVAYSTYLGGAGGDFGTGIGVDADGNAYVAGVTDSPDFPAKNAQAHSGDGFISKVGPTGSALLYSMRFVALGNEQQVGQHPIQVDPTGNVYLTGLTNDDLLRSLTCADSSATGSDELFAAKLAADGQGFSYFTLLSDLGGYGYQPSIAIDAVGSAYLTGTFSRIPTTGSTDALVAKLDPSGEILEYSGLVGGDDVRGDYTGSSIAVDSTGAAYAAGYTNSATLPVLAAVQPTKAGDELNPDAYLVKYDSLDDGGASLGAASRGGSSRLSRLVILHNGADQTIAAEA